MLGTLFLGSLAAYAIARLRFRYKLRSLLAIQIAGMIPPIVVIAPTFVLIRALGLLGTLPGMALPNMAYGIPLTTWLVASYFATIPFELRTPPGSTGPRPGLPSGGSCCPWPRRASSPPGCWPFWAPGGVYAGLHRQFGPAPGADRAGGHPELQPGFSTPVDLGLRRNGLSPHPGHYSSTCFFRNGSFEG